jgi:light-harvesting complex I chlorophyll a/b binding protein 5
MHAQLGAQAGLNFPQWYDAGKVAIENSPFSFQTLLGVQFLLFAWVETKRFLDFKAPGSQGDGSFFGITDDFKGVENGYPGEALELGGGAD